MTTIVTEAKAICHIAVLNNISKGAPICAVVAMRGLSVFFKFCHHLKRAYDTCIHVALYGKREKME